MDDIWTTFEADDEQDWLSSSEFENMFASVNNLTDNVSTSSLNDEKIGDFIEQNKNTNTAKKTKSDLNVWKRWSSTVGFETLSTCNSV